MQMARFFKVSVIYAATILSANLWAEDLASPNQFQALKPFGPPAPITPNVAQNYGVENQFDRTNRRDYFSVTNSIDNQMSPLRLHTGAYGKNYYSSALALARGANAYVMGNLNYTKANGYKDGKGDEVDFGYERFNQALVLGYVPNELNELKFTFLHDNIKDDKQPEYQVDAVKTDRKVFKFDGRLGLENLENTLGYGFSYRKIERDANNFKLRQSPQEMFVKLDRDIWDINLSYDKDLGNFHNKIGVIFTHDEHNGKRHRKQGQMSFVNAYRFADLDIHDYRVFDELSYKFNDQHQATLGLSYEINKAKAKKFNETLPNPQNAMMKFPSAAGLWQKFYGQKFDGSVDENAFGANVKYQFTPNDNQKHAVEVAHIERIGDNIERFNTLSGFVVNPMGAYMSPNGSGSGIIGNPFLDKEKHNFVKISGSLKNDHFKGYMNSLNPNAFHMGYSLMLDRVDDLIVFDRARGQAGIQEKSGDIIARNVDADMLVAKLDAQYNFNANWGVGSKLYYAYGKNRTDGRALYQIRPFELDVNVDYKNHFAYGSYNLGAGVRAVSKQSKGDFDKKTGLGIDNKEASKGFAVVDLYAGVNLKDNIGINFGVNNVLDKHYAEFISADHVEAFAPNVVYAPGRTFYINLKAAF